MSPEEKERKEIGSLPSHLQNLSGISEASTGRPKILLDNMQTQAQAFIREVNIIKIQRAVRAFMARLYVNYLRAERAVKDRCEMLIMYSAISEINTLMSVQVATEVYSENKKVDSGETALMYEMEKVVVKAYLVNALLNSQAILSGNVSEIWSQRTNAISRLPSPAIHWCNWCIIWWMKCSETRH